MKHTAVVGRIFFGMAVIGSGLLQLVRQDFVKLVPKLPGLVAAPSLWGSIFGALLVAAGAALVFDRKRHLVGWVMGTLLVVVFLLYVPSLAANPGAGYMWTNPCKTLAILSGAILLASSSAGSPGAGLSAHRRYNEWPWRLSAIFFGIFFVVGGIQHFVYLDFVTQLVPAWLPQRKFWACFAGVALVAGGLGVNFRPTARVAALSSGVMVFLWVIMLHIPRAFMMSTEPGETMAIFEALAISGVAFLLADTAEAVASRPAG